MSNYKVWHCVHYLKLALLCVLKKKKFLSEMVHLSPAAAKKYMYAICVRMCAMLGIHPLYVQSRPFLTEKLVRPYSDWLDRLLRPWKQWITQIAFLHNKLKSGHLICEKVFCDAFWIHDESPFSLLLDFWIYSKAIYLDVWHYFGGNSHTSWLSILSTTGALLMYESLVPWEHAQNIQNGAWCVWPVAKNIILK